MRWLGAGTAPKQSPKPPSRGANWPWPISLNVCLELIDAPPPTPAVGTGANPQSAVVPEWLPDVERFTLEAKLSVDLVTKREQPPNFSDRNTGTAIEVPRDSPGTDEIGARNLERYDFVVLISERKRLHGA